MSESSDYSHSSDLSNSSDSSDTYSGGNEHVYCCSAFYNSMGQLIVVEFYLCDDTNMWEVDEITYPEEDYEICDVKLHPFSDNPQNIIYDLERIERKIITRLTPIRLHQLIYECNTPKVWVIYDTLANKTTRYMHLPLMNQMEIREYYNRLL